MEVMSFEQYGRLVVAAWDDIMAKAKRLVMDNKVDVLTNRPEYIAGNVQGDHGDYNVEISRQDPNSGAITLWHCDCPWSQFSWGRTRQWKYLEGRPCSHTLALYWKALSTPIEAEEGYVPQPGQKGMNQEQLPEPEPTQAPTLPGMEPALPQTNPLEEPVKPGLKDMTLPTQPGAPQKFVKAPGPKAPPQHQKLQLWNITDLPGQEEGAQYAPPVSVPGGSQPGPGNPVYIPGALSSYQPYTVVHSNFIWYTASDFEMQVQEMLRNGVSPVVTLTAPVEMEMRGGKIPMPGAVPDGMTQSGIPTYPVMQLGYDPGSDMRLNSDETNPLGPGAPEQRGATSMAQPGQRGIITDIMPYTKDVKVIIPLHDTGPLHPHSLEAWVEYKDVRILPNAPDPYVKRTNNWVRV